MNKPVAIYMGTAGDAAYALAKGYVDALAYLGWHASIYGAQTKQDVRRAIEDYGATLIFTVCKYGTRQLPVDVINNYDVSIVAQALLWNARNETYGGTSELTDPADPYILQSIKRRVIHTACEPQIRDRYMHRWAEIDQPLLHLPPAANPMKCRPTSRTRQYDLAMAANFAHRPEVLIDWMGPLLRRLGDKFNLYLRGDENWSQIGVRTIPANKDCLPDIYAQSTVCPNLHMTAQRQHQACLNDRTFSVGLCGGWQVTDNPGISIYNPGHILGLLDTYCRQSCGLNVLSQVRNGVDDIQGGIVAVSIPLRRAGGGTKDIGYADLYPAFCEEPTAYINRFKVKDWRRYYPVVAPVDFTSLFDGASVYSYFDIPQRFRDLFGQMASIAGGMSEIAECQFDIEIPATGTVYPPDEALPYMSPYNYPNFYWDHPHLVWT